MNTMQKEDTVQAVLIADTYDKTLQPFVRESSTVSSFSFLYSYHFHWMMQITTNTGNT